MKFKHSSHEDRWLTQETHDDEDTFIENMKKLQHNWLLICLE